MNITLPFKTYATSKQLFILCYKQRKDGGETNIQNINNLFMSK